MALRALAGGCDGGGSRRGCGFCLHWSQNCLCPGLARKMPDGHLFQLLLTTALFPSILGTGTAPFLPILFPELFPDGPLALEGQNGGWGVCAGRQQPAVRGGGPYRGWWPRCAGAGVTPTAAHLWGLSAVPVGRWGIGRGFSTGEGGCGDVPGAFPSSLPPSPPVPMFALAEALASTGGHGVHRAVAASSSAGEFCSASAASWGVAHSEGWAGGPCALLARLPGTGEPRPGQPHWHWGGSAAARQRPSPWSWQPVLRALHGFRGPRSGDVFPALSNAPLQPWCRTCTSARATWAPMASPTPASTARG